MSMKILTAARHTYDSASSMLGVGFHLDVLSLSR
jgi:hypothetical protein